MTTLRKIAIASSAAGVALTLGLPAAFAATPHLSPPNTKVTATNKAGTALVIVGSIDGNPVTVTCKTFSGSGTTPANGLTVNLPKPPTFGGCTDMLGGTDTITNSGKWSITASSTGKTITLNIPKAGSKFTTNVLPGCVITVAPNGPAKITGASDNKSTWTIKNSPFPVVGNTVCSAGSPAKATSTVVFTPGVSVVG